jgi:FkbM family methyltransferase
MQIQQHWTMSKNKLSKLFGYVKDVSFARSFNAWQKEQQRLRRLRLWNKATMTQPMLAYRLETGATINLYSDDRLSKEIFVNQFEAKERAFVRSYLKAGDVFVDVGANIGLFTLIGATVVGPTGKVYAVEPTTTTYQRLLHNVRRNQLNQVECVQGALSDQEEARLMTISTEGFAARNSLGPPTAGTHFTQEKVQCYQWDILAAQRGLTGAVALMKIDIEGWEFSMLNGAQATLHRVDAPDLLVEFGEGNAQANGTSCVALYELLVGFGYKLYRLDARRKRLIPVPQEYQNDNLLATKNIEQVCRRTGYSCA